MSPGKAPAPSLAGGVITAGNRRNRMRSRTLFDLLTEDAYYSQPIAVRHPIVFYEGHLPAFSFNTLVKKALGLSGIDERLEALFARGIDPHEAGADVARSAGEAGAAWPSRDEVHEFAAEADRQVIEALANADLEQPGNTLLDRAEAVFTLLEHEAMHQETLLYMWHRLPFEQKRQPAGYRPRVAGAPPRREWIEIPPGRATLGVEPLSVPFGWDNECPALSAEVPAFAIERHDVTNELFLEFVEAGGYRDERWWRPDDWRWIHTDSVAHPLFWERHDNRWYWRGMFELVPLPLAWPVYVSHAEALAFTHWRDARLPGEAEFQRAAFGSAAGERRHPWGDAPPAPGYGVFA